MDWGGLWLDNGGVSHPRVKNLGQTAVLSPTSPVDTGALNQPGETVTLDQQETKQENTMASCT